MSVGGTGGEGGERNGILNNSLASFAHARAAPSFLIAERRVSVSSRLSRLLTRQLSNDTCYGI